MSEADRHAYAREQLILRAEYSRAIYHSRKAQQADLALCASDFFWWADRWGWMRDPQAPKDLRDMPVVIWEDQVELIRKWQRADASALEKLETVTVVSSKSRRLGVTGLMVLFLVHMWLFDSADVAFLSRVEDQVDKKGRHGTLFSRIRYLLDMQPMHLMPHRRNGHLAPIRWLDNSQEALDNFLTIQRLDTGASIVGFSTTGNSGRSDRYRAAGVDEFGAIEAGLAEELLAAMNSMTGLLMIVSNPPKRKHPLHDLIANLPVTQVYLQGWDSDPFRDDDFLARQREAGLLTEKQVNREWGGCLEVDTGETIWSIVKSATTFEEEDLPQDARRSWICIRSMDFGTGPSDVVNLWLLLELLAEEPGATMAKVPIRLWFDAENEWNRTHVDTIVADIKATDSTRYAGNTRGDYTGDPAGAAISTPEQTSWEIDLNARGIPIVCLPSEFNFKESAMLQGAIDLTQAMLDRLSIRVHSSCTRTLGAFEGWTWAGVKAGESAKDKAKATPSKVDGWSHIGVSILYGVERALVIRELIRRERQAAMDRAAGRTGIAAPAAPLSGPGSRQAVRDLLAAARKMR